MSFLKILFCGREWLARFVAVVLLIALVVSPQVLHMQPPLLPKPPATPITIALAAPPTPEPPKPVQPPVPHPVPPPPPEPVPEPPAPTPPPIETPSPIKKPVVKKPPVKKPPVKKPPVKKPPVKKPPVKKPPVKKPPVKKPPVKKPPVKKPPVKKPPVKQPPVKQPPVKSQPVKQATPDKAVATPPKAPAAPPAPAKAAPASNPSHEAAYVHKVRLQIEHHKVYPALARRLDMSGTVEVSYVLSRQGRLISVAIASSSGSKILDKAALQAVRTAVFPPIPEDAWRGEAQKQFKTKLIFSLNDD